MGTFLFVVIVIGCCIAYTIIQDKVKQEELQREEQEKEEKIQQRQNDIEFVKQFAEDNNSSIDYLLEKRDKLYNSASTNYLMGRLTQPLRPETVSPVYKGNALADYKADKINKERQENYYNLLASSQNKMNEGLKYQRECRQQEDRILEKLKDIPGSEKYIKILEKYFTEDHKIFNK